MECGEETSRLDRIRRNDAERGGRCNFYHTGAKGPDSNYGFPCLKFQLFSSQLTSALRNSGGGRRSPPKEGFGSSVASIGTNNLTVSPNRDFQPQDVEP